MTDERTARNHLLEIQRLDTELAKARATIERLEPLRTVLRGWDWKVIAEDGKLDDHCTEQVIAAFAHVEAAEAAAAHPASWLDCDDCRALTKVGAELPRCDVFIAKERTRG